LTVDLDRIGAESAETERSWDAPACALYALALGAGFDQPAFVAGREVYPTFVMSLSAAEAATWPDPAFATGDFDLHRVVLGQQSLVLHVPVEPTGRVRMRTRVASILDKGSGALITLETIAVDAETGDDAFTSASSLFVVGEGGFGGDRGPTAAAGYKGDILLTQMWHGSDLGRDGRGHAVVLVRGVNQRREVLVDRGRATIAH
jgi:hypothetical protein